MSIENLLFVSTSVHNSPAVCAWDHGPTGGLQRVHHACLPQPGRDANGQQYEERGVAFRSRRLSGRQ